jgi:DNA-binding SARP family transcriptional activator
VLHERREIRRECVADQLWRKSNAARQKSALNSAVWRIGKKLPKDAGIRLRGDSSTISLEIDPDIPVDARLLTELVHEGTSQDNPDQALVDRLSLVIEQTEAPFMDDRIDDWVLSERERLFNIRMRGLTLLLHWYGDIRRYEDALEVGRRLLSADPFREIAQIDMMWVYVLNGQRAQALIQYQTYADLLKRELNIEPMPETRALYDHIRRGLSSDGTAPANPPRSTPCTPLPRQKLDTMLMIIEQSRRDLYRVLRTQLG